MSVAQAETRLAAALFVELMAALAEDCEPEGGDSPDVAPTSAAPEPVAPAA